MTDDGYTTQDLTDTTSGKTWTYTNTTRWHEVWRVGIRLGTGRAPLTILLGSGTTRWAEPGPWIRFTAHSHDPYTSSGQDCTYAKTFTDYSHNLGPAQPYLQGVTAHEAKLTWNTQRGAEFCAAPAGYEPAKGYSRAELFSQTWMNHRLVNLATIPANGDDSTSVQKVVGFAVAPSNRNRCPGRPRDLQGRDARALIHARLGGSTRTSAGDASARPRTCAVAVAVAGRPNA